MIYLIHSWFRGGKSRLKVGFTDNLELRINSYSCSNPGHELISTRGGSELEEKKLHYYLTLLGYKSDIRNEWFEDVPEILTLFHEKISKINKTLWRFKNKIPNSKLVAEDIHKIYGNSEEFMKGMSNCRSVFEYKMEKLTKSVKENPGLIKKLPPEYRVYFESMSIDTLESTSLRKDDLDRRLGTAQRNMAKRDFSMVERVYEVFKEGEVYLNREIKSLLSGIYQGAKSNDIKLYFEVSRARVTNKITGKRDEGYKLIKRKY